MASIATAQSEVHSIDPRFDLRSSSKPRPKPKPRLILYGEPGVGKTTFGASAKNVIVIPTEDGALGVSVPKLPVDGKCRTFEDVLTAAKVLAKQEHDYEWLVIDTISGAEQLCAQRICENEFGGVWVSQRDTEGYNAFGKGDKATAQEMRALLNILDYLQQKRGMGIVLLAHVGLQKQANALGPDFYKFTGEMGKPTWALMCSWADQVGHACRDIRSATIDKEKKAKASAIGSERWVVFEGGPGRDAKSRVGYEMPERILLSWDDYEAELGSDRVGSLVEQVTELLEGAPEKQVRVVSDRIGGEITQESLRSIGPRKLEKLIGWLMATRKNQED